MERVLGEVMYSCCSYDHTNNTFAQEGPKEIRAATRVKNKKVYYTEIFEYDYATVALYYETENKSSTEIDLSILRYTSRVKKLRGQNLQSREHRGAAREQYIRN